MKAYACAALLAAMGVLAAGQASACPGAGGAPVVPNRTVANELVKFLLPQLLPGYGFEKSEATASGAGWSVAAYVARIGPAVVGSDLSATVGGPPPPPPPPQHAVLEVSIEGCSGAVLRTQVKPQ